MKKLNKTKLNQQLLTMINVGQPVEPTKFLEYLQNRGGIPTLPEKRVNRRKFPFIK